MSDNLTPSAEEELLRAYMRTARAQYAGQLPARLLELNATWLLLREQGWNADHVQALHRQVHRLHGSGAMYGFAVLSAAAQPLDTAAGLLAARATPLTASEIAEIEKLVDGLRTAVAECLRAVADEQTG